MVGEIDLSVGSVSGFASALVGVLWVNQGWPVALAILAALAFGAAIGALYASCSTASACRASSRRWPACSSVLGLQLYILGSTGSINLPYGSPLVDFGQTLVMPDPVAYALAAVPGAVLFARVSAPPPAAGLPDLSSQSLGSLILRAGRHAHPGIHRLSTSTSTAASRGCSACSSASSWR